MIIRGGSLFGWVLYEIIQAGEDVWRSACDAILERFADGTFNQHIAKAYPLDKVRAAHEEMERGDHIGKLVLFP